MTVPALDLRRGILLLVLCALVGCPEERPGAEKQIPIQRLPPALTVEPPPADGGPLAPGDGGRTRHP